MTASLKSPNTDNVENNMHLPTAYPYLFSSFPFISSDGINHSSQSLPEHTLSKGTRQATLALSAIKPLRAWKVPSATLPRGAGRDRLHWPVSSEERSPSYKHSKIFSWKVFGQFWATETFKSFIFVLQRNENKREDWMLMRTHCPQPGTQKPKHGKVRTCLPHPSPSPVLKGEWGIPYRKTLILSLLDHV